MGLRRLLVRMLDIEGGTEGQVPVIGPDGKFIIGDIATSATGLVPLTTEVGGVPAFVWDDNNQLVMTEVTL